MPNENIMGVPTRACINGLTKEDTDRLKNALIKKIEDDETTVDITEDGKIILANENNLFLSFDGNILGITKDSSGDYIPWTVPYLPEDENENPIVPPNDVIMTSANIAVDPRIVHTTGNETITGTKIFETGLVGYFKGWIRIEKTANVNDYLIFAKIDVTEGTNRDIKIDLFNFSNTVPAMGSIIFRTLLNAPNPRWIYHTPFTVTNNPITATSIVILTKDNEMFLAWKKEYQYGKIMVKVDFETAYGYVQGLNTSRIKIYNTNEIVVISDISSYTKFEVE